MVHVLGKKYWFIVKNENIWLSTQEKKPQTKYKKRVCSWKVVGKCLFY